MPYFPFNRNSKGKFIFKKLMAASLLSLTIATPALSDVEKNKAFVGAALNELFVEKDVTAVDRYFGSQYIQHNPDVASGAQALKGLAGYLANNENFKLHSYRIIGEGDLVATHSVYEGFAEVPLVAFDV